MSLHDKELHEGAKATDQASEVPKRMYYEPLGQNSNINYVTKISNNLHDLVF